MVTARRQLQPLDLIKGSRDQGTQSQPDQWLNARAKLRVLSPSKLTLAPKQAWTHIAVAAVAKEIQLCDLKSTEDYPFFECGFK